MTEETDTEETNTEDVIEDQPQDEKQEPIVGLSDEVKDAITDDNKKTEGEDKEEDKDPANKEEDGDGDDADPDETSTDIVFPEDSNLSEEQQSEIVELFGSKEKYEKAINILQDIGSKQAEKDEAAAVATAEAKSAANEEALKKDSEFGKEYEANLKGVEDLANEIGLPESLDVKDPDTAKALLKIVNERADAKVHIEKTNVAPKGPAKDAYGNSQMDLSKTMEQLNKRK